VSTRTWFPGRPAFDAAVDLDPEGVVEYVWPPEVSLSVLPATTETQRVLAEEVQKFTAIANHRDVEAVNVEEFLVAPRLLGMPFRDAVAARQLDADREVPTVDSEAIALSGRVILVSGDNDSGVTSTLYWLLNRHVEQRGTHRPAYRRVPKGFFRASRFHRDLVKTSRKFSNEPVVGDSPRLVAALDDIDFDSPDGYAALAKYINAHPEVVFVLGCHTDEHDTLVSHLKNAAVDYSPAYLAPFGRQQVRVIIEKITGTFSQELLDKMYAVLAAASLPRDPFLMVALTAVLYSSGDPSSLNESSILENYVALLLGGAEIVDDEGLQMDRRRREYLLQELAGKLSTLPLQRMLRHEAEVFVNDQYQRMEWGNRPQGSRVIESLVKRRALIEVDGFIQFRYSGYFDLFLGKLVLDDPAFRARVKKAPLLFGPAIRHAAGMSRRDKDLLDFVRGVSEEALDTVRGIIDLGDLENVGARSRWKSDEYGPRLLEAMITSDDREEVLSQEEKDARRDAFYDEMHIEKEDSVVTLTPAQLDEFQRLEQATMLLGQVLKSGEFIQDVDDKTDALASALDGWGHVMVAAVTDTTSDNRYQQLREWIRADLGIDDEASNDPELAAEIDFLLDVTIMALHAAVAHASMGHSHLEGAFKRVFAQPGYFDRGAEAFIATLIYFFLDLDGWPEYVGKFLQAQGRLPAVQPVVTSVLVSRYVLSTTRHATRKESETLLADLVIGGRSGSNGASKIVGRASSKGQLLTHLRKRRSDRMLKAENIPVEERPLPGDQLEVLDAAPVE
jgi:hypothetical protein